MSEQLCRGRVLRWVVLCVGLTFLAACQSPPPAPIDQRPPPPSEKINYHIVSRGETLFAIAWRYEKDVDKLARANRLTRPYTILVASVLPWIPPIFQQYTERLHL